MVVSSPVLADHQMLMPKKGTHPIIVSGDLTDTANEELFCSFEERLAAVYVRNRFGKAPLTVVGS